ncbi:hypothetical protein ASE52_18705 [Acidovorax sp. Root275]|nr:hypothetical protein ASC83_02455 [Acidovorax sp. Root402]KRD46661.1 hypothetical protein ASE52_18705 [Acidovorax sp. Root275]
MKLPLPGELKQTFNSLAVLRIVLVERQKVASVVVANNAPAKLTDLAQDILVRLIKPLQRLGPVVCLYGEQRIAQMAPHAGIVELDRPGVGNALQVPFIHVLNLVVHAADRLHAQHAEHDCHEEDDEKGERELRRQGGAVVVLNNSVHETRSSLFRGEVMQARRSRQWRLAAWEPIELRKKAE